MRVSFFSVFTVAHIWCLQCATVAVGSCYRYRKKKKKNGFDLNNVSNLFPVDIRNTPF